jgi:hypothetical protein
MASSVPVAPSVLPASPGTVSCRQWSATAWQSWLGALYWKDVIHAFTDSKKPVCTGAVLKRAQAALGRHCSPAHQVLPAATASMQVPTPRSANGPATQEWLLRTAGSAAATPTICDTHHPMPLMPNTTLQSTPTSSRARWRTQYGQPNVACYPLLLRCMQRTDSHLPTCCRTALTPPHPQSHCCRLLPPRRCLRWWLLPSRLLPPAWPQWQPPPPPQWPAL